MKRIAVLLAGLVTAALVFVTAPSASAEECLTVPDLPGECLTQHVYDYLTNMTEQRDRAQDNVLTYATYASGLADQNAKMRADLWAQATVTQQVRAELSSANSALGIAYEWIDFLEQKVKRQAKTIKALRAKVKALEAKV